MRIYEKKQLEIDFKRFTRKHFEKPSKFKNLQQVQFYVREIALKIEEFEQRFNYVPKTAYVLLSEYNASQNKMIFNNFQQSYA